jgi:hypothetical protein
MENICQLTSFLKYLKQETKERIRGQCGGTTKHAKLFYQVVFWLKGPFNILLLTN